MVIVCGEFRSYSSYQQPVGRADRPDLLTNIFQTAGRQALRRPSMFFLLLAKT